MLLRRRVQRLLCVLGFVRTYPPQVTLPSRVTLVSLGYPVKPYVTMSLCRHLYQLMSTVGILSILVYRQYGYHTVYHTGLSLVNCSYLSVGSLQRVTINK